MNLKSITEEIYVTLKKYESLICSDVAQLGLALDHRFWERQ